MSAQAETEWISVNAVKAWLSIWKWLRVVLLANVGNKGCLGKIINSKLWTNLNTEKIVDVSWTFPTSLPSLQLFFLDREYGSIQGHSEGGISSCCFCRFGSRLVKFCEYYCKIRKKKISFGNFGLAKKYALPRKVKFFADCAVSFQRVSLTCWLAVLLWSRINIFRDIMRLEDSVFLSYYKIWS